MIEACKENEDLDSLNIRQISLDFLLSTGINTVKTKIEPTPTGISLTFKQRQGYQADRILVQKMDYLLIRRVGDDFEIKKHSVFLPGSTEVISVEFEGYEAEHTYVIANADDHAYIQYILNVSTVDVLSQGLL